MKKDAVWNERIKETGNEKKNHCKREITTKSEDKGIILHKL